MGKAAAPIARGHDVELHLHTAYARTHSGERRWLPDYRDYDLAHLRSDRIYPSVKQGKDHLEGLLRRLRPAPWPAPRMRSGNQGIPGSCHALLPCASFLVGRDLRVGR